LQKLRTIVADQQKIQPPRAITRPPRISPGLQGSRTIKASRKRVYDVLTDTEQFRKLSGGGVITGRHIELVPGERIVQAWRSEWAPGDCSIARFVLKDQGSDTKIVFDHTGFPQGKAEHLRLWLESILLRWASAILCVLSVQSTGNPKEDSTKSLRHRGGIGVQQIS
jgi:hypothetical protein